MGICIHDKVDDIQCRPTKAIKGLKNVKENVDCSLKKGLVCDGKCKDYEIRIHCKCQKESSKYKRSYLSKN